MTTRWYPYGERWHAIKETASEGARTESLCGQVLDGAPPHVVESTETDLYPPNPCATCQMEVAMADVEDEPLAEAKARGYLPWTPEVMAERGLDSGE